MPLVRVAPVTELRGSVRVPPDKSLTHRALMLSAVSDREVRIGRPLDSAATSATRCSSRGAGFAGCARPRRSTAPTRAR
jgi:5-enolpyruvylshikimate-3-phosphate synthase